MHHLGSNIMSVFILKKKNPGNSSSEGKRKTVQVSGEFKLTNLNCDIYASSRQ